MTEAVHGDNPQARVWSQTEVKVNLGDYESVTVSLGTSRPIRNNKAAIARMHKTLHEEHMTLLSERVEEIREIWSNK